MRNAGPGWLAAALLLPALVSGCATSKFASHASPPPPARRAAAADRPARVIAPPIVYLENSREKSAVLTPLYGKVADKATREEWQYMFPLFYAERSQGGDAVWTVLGGYWRDRNGMGWAAFPLLTGGHSGESRDDLWVLGPIAHASWGPQADGSHVIPLFYNDPRKGMFITPLVARWSPGEGKQTWAAPLLLSQLTTAGRENDLRLLLNAVRIKWGGEHTAGHVFPLYFSDMVDKSRRVLFTPLLLQYTETEGKKELSILLDLCRHAWGDPLYKDEGYCFPFYAYKQDSYFYTPIYGWTRDGNRGSEYLFTPLVGVRTGDTRGWWLFPFVSHHEDPKSGASHGRFLWGEYRNWPAETRNSLLPFYDYRRSGSPDQPAPSDPGSYVFGTRFFCLPGFTYRNQATVSVYRDQVATERVRDFNLCWIFRRTSEARAAGSAAASRVTRESTEILWRIFRVARGSDGAQDMDVLFVPVMRHRPAPARPAPRVYRSFE